MLRSNKTAYLAVVENIDNLEVARKGKKDLAIGFAKTEKSGEGDNAFEHVDSEYMVLTQSQAKWLVKELKRKLKKK